MRWREARIDMGRKEGEMERCKEGGKEEGVKDEGRGGGVKGGVEEGMEGEKWREKGG